MQCRNSRVYRYRDKAALPLNQIAEVGFDTIDFGSFVSQRRFPQMRDTAGGSFLSLNLHHSKSQITLDCSLMFVGQKMHSILFSGNRLF